MKKIGVHGLVALALGCGLAAQAAGPLEDQARAGATQAITAWVERDFKLPADLALDAPLRQRLEGLASAHRERVVALGRTWIDEELPRVDLGANPTALNRNVTARYLNESAIWQLDSTGEAYDKLMLRDVLDPGSCLAQEGKWPFGAFAAALQKMTGGERELALAAQEQLLSRWGQVRAIPDRPVPSLLEQGLEALAKLRAPKRPEGEPAVPPVLAYNLLATPPRGMEFDMRCPLVRWTLSREPMSRASATTQMALARHALLADAVALFRPRAEAGADVGSDGYPRVARMFGVEGDVDVEGRRGANGQGLEAAHVTRRQVKVPGVRGTRAVAFETVFDQASLDRAAKTPPKPGPDEAARIPFTWMLK